MYFTTSSLTKKKKVKLSSLVKINSYGVWARLWEEQQRGKVMKWGDWCWTQQDDEIIEKQILKNKSNSKNIKKINIYHLFPFYAFIIKFIPLITTIL